MTTETPEAEVEDRGPCVHLLNEPCCAPEFFERANHHQDAPADCTCDLLHHLLLEPVLCGLDAVWHGEHPQAPGHDYEAAADA